ncbi:lytic transglycosylase domain-containing protein [Phytoactinopolyspora halophila]|nr:lytic transglycosylase domain-containing protein [Phytoactinopolyspora halophila]
MPDVVQYRNPQEVLASMRAEEMEASFADASSQGLSSGVERPDIVPTGVSDAVDRQRNFFETREQHLRHRRLMAEQQEMMSQTAGGPWTRTYNVPMNKGTGVASGFNAAVGAPGGGGEFAQLMSAIAQQESGGNYNARNASSGALGKYQIMPSNVGPWSREAIGRAVSTEEFLNNPNIQESVARHQLHKYYRQYGARGAAIAWYAGPGALKYNNGALNRPQGDYPSISGYAQNILERMGL